MIAKGSGAMKVILLVLIVSSVAGCAGSSFLSALGPTRLPSMTEPGDK